MITTLTTILALTAAAPETEPLEFLICQPGGPELETQEQTVIQDFYRYVGEKMGLPRDSINGAYFNRREDCIKALSKQHDLLLLSLDLYLEHEAMLKLKPVVQIQRSGSTTDRFYLMTRSDVPKEIEPLRRKLLTGTHLSNPRFVSRILLQNKLGSASELNLKPEALGLRAVRNVLRERAHAVLLDGAQFRALGGTPFERKLQNVYTSQPLPNPPLALSARRTDSDFAKRLVALLTAMREDPAGQKLLSTFDIDGFVKADATVYDPIRKEMGL